MTKAAAALLVDALRLSPEARAELAAELLASLDGPADPAAEAAWAAEIERRVDAIEAGTITLEAWEDVKRRIERDVLGREAHSDQWSGVGRIRRRPSLVRQKRTGIGSEFFDAMAQAIELVRTRPEVGTAAGRLTRFPYRLVYRVRDHDIHIVASAHTSRRPGYWENRL